MRPLGNYTNDGAAGNREPGTIGGRGCCVKIVHCLRIVPKSTSGRFPVWYSSAPQQALTGVQVRKPSDRAKASLSIFPGKGAQWLVLLGMLLRLRREIDRKLHRKCPRPSWKAWSCARYICFCRMRSSSRKRDSSGSSQTRRWKRSFGVASLRSFEGTHPPSRPRRGASLPSLAFVILALGPVPSRRSRSGYVVLESFFIVKETSRRPIGESPSAPLVWLQLPAQLPSVLSSLSYELLQSA